MQPATIDMRLPSQLREFVIVSDGSRWFFGLPARSDVGDEWVRLDPCFDYHATTQLTPQGMQRMCMLAPLEMMASMDRVDILPRVIFSLTYIDDREVAHFASLIDRAEAMRVEIRAAQSGIAIAGPGAINGAGRR